ncbi:MAG TPA: hypothetical protein VIP28_00200 [Nocardioides sp.]
MSPAEKLTAAAERIEHQLADAATISPVPWSVDEDCFVDDAARFNVGEVATPAEADLIVSAVNAMPALAEWLRSFAEFAAPLEDPALEAALPVPSDLLTCALAIADQILGGE